jgi:hypothetical protein
VNTLTTGRIGQFLARIRQLMGPVESIAEFCRNLVRQDKPEDPKRLVMLVSAGGLVMGWLKLAWAAAGQIQQGHDIASGVATTLGALALLIAGLAGYVHRKPDDPLPPDGGVQ